MKIAHTEFDAQNHKHMIMKAHKEEREQSSTKEQKVGVEKH